MLKECMPNAKKVVVNNAKRVIVANIDINVMGTTNKTTSNTKIAYAIITTSTNHNNARKMRINRMTTVNKGIIKSKW